MILGISLICINTISINNCPPIAPTGSIKIDYLWTRRIVRSKKLMIAGLDINWSNESNCFLKRLRSSVKLFQRGG